MSIARATAWVAGVAVPLAGAEVAVRRSGLSLTGGYPSRMRRDVPPQVLKVIAARSSAETQPLALAFGRAALSRDVQLIEHRSKRPPSYFRIVHAATTVAYVRPRRDAVRVECRIPFSRQRQLQHGVGYDGAFGPWSWCFDIADEAGIAGALELLDEAVSVVDLER
jgi:hypothetical protein